MTRSLTAMSACLVGLGLGLLAGCAGQAAPAGTARATPRGILASGPPGDPSFTPLRCVPTGPGLECSRHE
jgi:hypothetical protein